MEVTKESEIVVSGTELESAVALKMVNELFCGLAIDLVDMEPSPNAETPFIQIGKHAAKFFIKEDERGPFIVLRRADTGQQYRMRLEPL